jgi:hypothetical protein
MRRLDSAAAPELLARLACIPLAAPPLWGTLTPAQLFGHLGAAVRYTMGEGPQFPFRGNWKSRHVFRRLILLGVVKIPRNVRIPRLPGKEKEPSVPEGTLDELREVVIRYHELQAEGRLGTVMHPFFGPLSPAAWARFHWLHFDHHCRQFRV